MSGNLPRSKEKGSELKADDKTTANKNHSSGDRSRDKPKEIRLQDINEQLEMAQSRCNYLKDQLDYMKKMYDVNGNRLLYRQRKISNSQSSTCNFQAAGHMSELPYVPKENSQDEEATKATQSPRVPANCQKLNYIDIDNSRSVVRTMNNILNGITNSVNHLSEMHSQLATPRMKIFSKVNANAPMKATNLDIVPELKVEGLINMSPKHRGLKRTAIKSGKYTITINKPARVEKKTKSVTTKSNTALEKKPSAMITNRLVNKLISKNNNLLEIYHNKAVKHSYSEESDLKKFQERCEKLSREDVPPLNIHASNRKSCPEQTAITKLNCPAELTGQFADKPPEVLRTEVKWVYSKNYKLPTVASRMKQVAKAYMGNLNLKTIPFCAAISTTQSHNIGINIQQLMNIIKNRQPMVGISPTLAHNIGLAAQKLNNRAFSAFVSNINSKMRPSTSGCQAKTMPEVAIEEAGGEVDEDAEEAQTVSTTEPSEDMETKTRTAPNWQADKDFDIQHCLAQNTVRFHQILNRYQRHIKTITENSSNSHENELKKRFPRYKTTTRNQMGTKVHRKTAAFQDVQVHASSQDRNLNGKETNPNGFLANLHTDLEHANRFEELSRKSRADESEPSKKELEPLEELNKPEITSEMTLYHELLALKQEVKQLKGGRSQSGLPSREHYQDAEITCKEYRNHEAAILLIKLLKQIRHCQMIYKSNLSQG